jgi:hypothetical protein
MVNIRLVGGEVKGLVDALENGLSNYENTLCRAVPCELKLRLQGRFNLSGYC